MLVNENRNIFEQQRQKQKDTVLSETKSRKKIKKNTRK